MCLWRSDAKFEAFRLWSSASDCRMSHVLKIDCRRRWREGRSGRDNVDGSEVEQRGIDPSSSAAVDRAQHRAEHAGSTANGQYPIETYLQQDHRRWAGGTVSRGVSPRCSRNHDALLVSPRMAIARTNRGFSFVLPFFQELFQRQQGSTSGQYSSSNRNVSIFTCD